MWFWPDAPNQYRCSPRAGDLVLSRFPGDKILSVRSDEKSGSMDDAFVGLFPGFESTGGVQTSGRLAWEAIVGLDPPGAPVARRCRLLCIDPSHAADGWRTSEQVHCGSRVAAVR